MFVKCLSVSLYPPWSSGFCHGCLFVCLFVCFVPVLCFPKTLVLLHIVGTDCLLSGWIKKQPLHHGVCRLPFIEFCQISNADFSFLGWCFQQQRSSSVLMLNRRSVQLREECKHTSCECAGRQKLSFSSSHLAWNSRNGVRDTVALCPPLLSLVCILLLPQSSGPSTWTLTNQHSSESCVQGGVQMCTLALVQAKEYEEEVHLLPLGRNIAENEVSWLKPQKALVSGKKKNQP